MEDALSGVKFDVMTVPVLKDVVLVWQKTAIGSNAAVSTAVRLRIGATELEEHEFKLMRLEHKFKALTDKDNQLSYKQNKELERFVNAEAEIQKLQDQHRFVHTYLASEMEKLKEVSSGGAACVQELPCSDPRIPKFICSRSMLPLAL